MTLGSRVNPWRAARNSGINRLQHHHHETFITIDFGVRFICQGIRLVINVARLNLEYGLIERDKADGY